MKDNKSISSSSNDTSSEDTKKRPTKVDKPIPKDKPEEAKIKKAKKKMKKYKTRTKILKKPNNDSNKKLIVSQWDIKEVSKWLDKVGLVKEFPNIDIISLFENNDINGKALLLLENEDLREMGIQSIGIRKAILYHIAEMKKGFKNGKNDINQSQENEEINKKKKTNDNKNNDKIKKSPHRKEEYISESEENDDDDENDDDENDDDNDNDNYDVEDEKDTRHKDKEGSSHNLNAKVKSKKK